MNYKIVLSNLLFEKYPEMSRNLTSIFDKYNIKFKTVKTKDIWVRDFMPFLLDDGTLVSYVYEPNYLQDKKYESIKTKIIYEKNHINLVIDGGNFVRYKNKAIMTDKIFKENKNSKGEIVKIIKSQCKLDELIIIPKQPYDRYGHSDSIVRWVDEESVVINDFSKYDKNFKDTLVKVLNSHNLNVKFIKYSDNFFDKKSWGAYLNFIKIDNILIVPIYGIDEDNLVLKQLQKIYENCIIETVKCKKIISLGGALHCITAESSI